MEAVSGIKVFRLNDYDWWAGAALEECVADACEAYAGMDKDEIIVEPRELTDKEMDDQTFTELLSDQSIRLVTWRAYLQELVSENIQFPTPFASA